MKRVHFTSLTIRIKFCFHFESIWNALLFPTFGISLNIRNVYYRSIQRCDVINYEFFLTKTNNSKIFVFIINVENEMDRFSLCWLKCRTTMTRHPCGRIGFQNFTVRVQKQQTPCVYLRVYIHVIFFFYAKRRKCRHRIFDLLDRRSPTVWQGIIK